MVWQCNVKEACRLTCLDLPTLARLLHEAPDAILQHSCCDYTALTCSGCALQCMLHTGSMLRVPHHLDQHLASCALHVKRENWGGMCRWHT